MASGPTNLTPPSGDGNPYDRKHHLRVIPTPDVAQEVSSAAIDPAGMGSQDVASLLRLEQRPPAATDATDLNTQLSAPIVPDDDKAVATYDVADDGRSSGASRGVDALPSGDQPGGDLGDFELRYADGTATPSKHRVLFRRTRNQGPDHHEHLQAVLAETGPGVRAAHHDDEWGDGPAEVETSSRGLAQQHVDISDKPTNGRPLMPLIVLTAALLLIGIVLVAGLIGGGSGEPKAAQTVVQTVTTPVTVTRTTPAKTTTTPKHHVKRHRIVRHQTTKPKATVTTPATSTTASNVSTSQSTYTAPAYTAPAYTQPAQPSRTVSSESGSATTGSSTRKSSSSSKSSSTGGSLSAGQQAALNPS